MCNEVWVTVCPVDRVGEVGSLLSDVCNEVWVSELWGVSCR